MSYIYLKARLLIAVSLVALFSAACSVSPQIAQERPHIILSTENGMPIIQFDRNLSTLSVDRQNLIKTAAAEDLNAEQWLLENFDKADLKGLSEDTGFQKLADIVSDNDLDAKDVYWSVLARYISKTDFACKEPLYYQYFQARYNLYEKEVSCETAILFNVLSRYTANNIVYVDPKRLRDIHVVFASKDDNMMSKFGHISLRLVICPQENSTDAECDANLYQHIVLGYMAHVDDIKINRLKGLFGDYKAYLYANSFMDVYQIYTISEQEREAMLRSLAEIHWGFAGDYKFTHRNCSSLMQLALSAMWPNFSEEKSLQALYWRPDSFFQALQTTTIAYSSALTDLELAEEGGFYFASTEAIYSKAFDVVNEAMQNYKYSSLRDYLSTNPILRYNAAQENTSYIARLQSNAYLLEAQLLLEELSLVKFESIMNAEMGYFFSKYGIEEIKAHMHQSMSSESYVAFSECVLGPLRERIRPIKRRDGIPDSLELASESALKSCQAEDKAKLLKQVNFYLESLDPEAWADVKTAVYYWAEIINNINSYKELGNK
jgi:hypothetical protein